MADCVSHREMDEPRRCAASTILLPMSRELKDRVIIITGASAGIGEATAIECAKQGMKVVISARREDRLNEVAESIQQAGGEALVVPCDVTKDDEVNTLVGKTVEHFGGLDVMFANAGYGIFSPIADTPMEDVRAIFETNFFGTVRCINAAVPIMRKQESRGHILICTSSISEIGLPMYGYYAATKSAQDAIGCAMRAELALEGIDVSTVHPIGTKSEFFDVVREISPDLDGRAVDFNTPASMMHSSEQVARAIIACLKKPKPEVWPALLGRGVRFGLAISTAFPGLSAWNLRGMMRDRYKKNGD